MIGLLETIINPHYSAMIIISNAFALTWLLKGLPKISLLFSLTSPVYVSIRILTGTGFAAGDGILQLAGVGLVWVAAGGFIYITYAVGYYMQDFLTTSTLIPQGSKNQRRKYKQKASLNIPSLSLSAPTTSITIPDMPDFLDTGRTRVETRETEGNTEIHEEESDFDPEPIDFDPTPSTDNKNEPTHAGLFDN